VVLDTSLHHFTSAIKHLKQVLDISEKNGFQIITVTALQNLAAVYTKTGDYKAANQYRSNYINLKDSIANAKSKTDLNDLEISYEVLQKEQEIALLRKDNDIANIKLQNNKRSLIFYITGFCMLLTIIGFIFFQRSQRLKLETQKQKAELEMQVLRSQMNPHFIFNSLNSIENFIMHNEKRLASDYLNKFSRLIRSILDSSRNELVPLAKDMDALRLYVELEQLRFNNKFTFHIYIDPALLQGDYQVPSLLIQPYVENAIVHGIAHSNKEDLEITVTAVLNGDYIKYAILDNGVGRKKAAAYNLQNKPKHTSVGLKITEDRIAHYNMNNPVKDAVIFTDLTDENNEPLGTKVEITINAL
jgi:LytS/YehU family sensor histidine kinase